MSTKIKCNHCKTEYCLPDTKKAIFKDMRVVSNPYTDGKQVWFWSKKDDELYLNFSCKKELDLVFLRMGQIITSEGSIHIKDVHVKWKCPVCGEVLHVDEEIPCLVNTDTKIQLMKVS